MTDYAEKMQYRHPPIQEHLVYSHLISSNIYATCIYTYYVIFTAHIYVCKMPLPSCLINMSLSWEIPWENHRRAFCILTLFI
jgi:hypothetical protein